MKQQKKVSELSPYYNREFHRRHTLAEEMQIFQWLQFLREHFQLFNVLNYHDCIRANREASRPVIIRPFESITNFYGCIQCGKYHICRLERECCPLVIDGHDKQKACAYSGQLLLIQDNLEATFEDGQHADKEATYLQSHRRHDSPKKSSPKSKKPQRTHVQDLLKEEGTDRKQLPQPLSSKKRPRLSEESRAKLKEVYDMSIDGLSELEDNEEWEVIVETKPEEVEEAEEILDFKPLKRARRMDEMKEEVVDEYSSVIGAHKLAENSSDGDEETQDEVCVEKKWLATAHDDGEESGGDECIGTLLEHDNENGNGDRHKNYHNNIRYNNEYYAFLRPLIKKSEERLSRYDQFIDLYRRDIHEDEHFQRQPTNSSTDEEEYINKLAENEKLGESTLTKIQSETSVILTALLHSDRTQRPLCKLKRPYIHQRLLAHFKPLIENITLLIYQSPILSKVALTRCTKNQNQVPKFSVSEIDLESAQNLQSDVEHHEYTFCPLKIVRALMLHLFLQPYALTDAHGYRIEIWYRDEWLSTFKRVALDSKRRVSTLCDDYYAYALKNEIIKSSVTLEQFKKEVLDSVAQVEDCLGFYKFCPLWLRYMVQNGHEESILNV